MLTVYADNAFNCNKNKHCQIKNQLVFSGEALIGVTLLEKCIFRKCCCSSAHQGKDCVFSTVVEIK